MTSAPESAPPTPATTPDTSLRWAGLLLVVALTVEALSLTWFHPLSFVTFAAGGGLLTLLGVGLYLRSLLR